MSSSDSEDSVQIQIRERDQDVDTYVKPALLVEYEKEVAKENELLGSEAEDSEGEELLDESDEEEDEEAAMLTPAIDTQISKPLLPFNQRIRAFMIARKSFLLINNSTPPRNNGKNNKRISRTRTRR
ncbi:unnamed protein product [Absidia cylindrospora]